jgi:di/tricarboxylate transporter
MVGRQLCFVENVGPFKDFVITPSKMKKWGWSQWFILYMFGMLVLVWTYSQYIEQVNVTKLQWYGLALLITVVTIITYAIRDKYELHLHHFFIFATLLSMSICSGNLGAILDGVFYGFYVDGIAEWGLAPIWQPK